MVVSYMTLHRPQSHPPDKQHQAVRNPNTMNEIITSEKLQEGIDAAIADRGADYMYQQEHDGICMYVLVEHNAEGERTVRPGCLIGYALHHIGVPLGVLSKLDLIDDDGIPEDSSSISSPEAEEALNSAGFEFAEGVRSAARAAQRVQDRLDGTWGEAREGYQNSLKASIG